MDVSDAAHAGYGASGVTKLRGTAIAPELDEIKGASVKIGLFERVRGGHVRSAVSSQVCGR